MKKQSQILFCNCIGAQNLEESVPQGIKEHILNHCQGESSVGGVSVTLIDDLCHFAAKERAILSESLKLAGDITLIASCSQRAIVSLLRYAGIEIGTDTINRFISYRESSVSAVCVEIDDIISRAGGLAELKEIKLEYKPANLAWYPVLDNDRCIDCRQCENFCLFGVYCHEGGKVIVNKPTKCKPYCPACSRICPKSAVIFPKHEKPQINGSELREDIKDEKSISEMKGNDLMGFLRNRSSLAEKAAELDIPQELVDSLSPEQLKNIVNKKK